MFSKKDRSKEQEEKAQRLKQEAEKNRQIQTTIKTLQEQIARHAGEAQQLKAELEKAREGEQAASQYRKKFAVLQSQVRNLQDQLKQSEAEKQALSDEIEDMEELSAEEQTNASKEAGEKLATARAKFQALQQQVTQVEEENQPSEMAIGNPTWVRREGGKGLNRRDAPGLGSNVLDSFAIGTKLVLLEGPNPADGYTWWRVRCNDGREGWVAGEELLMQPE